MTVLTARKVSVTHQPSAHQSGTADSAATCAPACTRAVGSGETSCWSTRARRSGECFVFVASRLPHHSFFSLTGSSLCWILFFFQSDPGRVSVHSFAEPSCRRDQKLFTNDLLYSGPRLVSACLKFPCTSLGDVVLKSMLFTLDIIILEICSLDC